MNLFQSNVLLICFLFLIFSYSYAQEIDSIKKNFNQNELIIENILDKDIDEKTEDFVEDLLYLKENQIDINKAKENDFKQIPFLTQFHIYSIIEYRKKFGDLKSFAELQYVDGFNEDMIKKILPYIKISNYSSIQNYSNLRFDMFCSLLMNSNFNSIYKDTTWESTSFKNSFRLKYSQSNFNVTLKGEKDWGEAFFNKSNKYGYDFYSGYFEIFLNKFTLKRIILGDYQVKSGQGLTLWNGYDFKKTIYNIELMKYEKNLVEYNGMNEYDFFRGLAIETKFKKIESIYFVSYNRLDAYSFNFDSTENKYFTSIITSGLHRNKNEIKNEKNVNITVCGTKLKYMDQILHIGMTLLNTAFSLPFNPDSNIYNYFTYRGKKLFKGGFDFLLNTKIVDFFGEFSYNNKKLAYLSGISTKSDYGTILSLLIRNYPSGFNTLFANPISEYSKFENEKGIIFSFKIPVNKLIIRGIVDVFYSKWLRYLINSPSYGKDLFIQCDYPFYESNLLSLSFAYSDKCNSYYRTDDRIPYSYNVKNFTCKANSVINLNNVIEVKSSILYNHRLSKEYLTIKSFVFSNYYSFSWSDQKNKITTGFTYYYISDYNIKLYYYEPFLYMNSGFKTLSGKGIRYVFIYKIKNFKNWKFYFKYSQSPIYKNSLHLLEFIIGYKS